MSGKAPTHIYIPNWRPATLNSLMGHWSKAHKLKKADREMIFAYCNGLPRASGKRRVSLHITYGKGMRVCDPDAFWKSTLDALVQGKMLVDDSDKYVELGEVKQKRVAKGVHMLTRITLQDIMEND